MTNSGVVRARAGICEAFPGIVEGLPHSPPGMPGMVVVWRGTKVLVRKVRSFDRLPGPAGDGGVVSQ